MLRPSWPIERLLCESERIWELHVQKNGPPLVRLDSAAPAPSEMPTLRVYGLRTLASHGLCAYIVRNEENGHGSIRSPCGKSVA